MKRITQLCLLAFGMILLIACAAPESTSSKIATPESELKMVSRSEWGWVDLSETLPEHTIQYITLHHGGEDFPADKDVIAYLRNLQSWSRSDKGWIDIPYHYMIDLEGTIYEARPIQYPGDTNTSYDPTGHALICVMGNYENQTLSPEQLEAVIRLSAKLAAEYEVPVDRIKGHKDYAETACPGEDFYRYIADGTIAAGVQAQLY